MFEAIVAVYGDWGIGAGGTQPVVVSADRKHFREITDGATVICGRKTLEDFPGGKPLKNRTNIVLTRQALGIDGAVVAHSAEEVLAEAPKFGRSFVIGGASTYLEFFPHIYRVFVTKLDCVPHSDAFFPNLDEDPDWEITEESEEQTDENGIRYRFLTYTRRLSPELQAALDWLRSADAVARMGAVNSILRRSAELRYFRDSGMLLYDPPSLVWYAFGDGWTRLPGVGPGQSVFTDSALAAESIAAKFGALQEAYMQFAYPFAVPPVPDVPGSLSFRRPTDDEMLIIDSTYALAEMPELQRDRARGDLFTAHDREGNFVGYMGIHAEGSMGLLEIFPAYRHLGYAEEFEIFILTKILARRCVPICQVAVGNTASESLQRKLGLEPAPNGVWYVWR